MPGQGGRKRIRVAALAVTIAASAGLSSCGDSRPAAAQDGSGLEGRLDRALARGAEEADAPGATAAVVKDGRVVWSGAYGRARGGRAAAMTPAARFPIASTTKTVTATMAMALAERGELRLNRPIHRELPRLPASRRITPRLLMSHSSGLNDYFDDGAVGRIFRRHPFHRWTRGQVLSHVRRVRFRPGSRHAYSNANYVALGGVLTRDSHLSVERLFRRLVATPLALTHSAYRYGALPQRAFAHPLRKRPGGGVWDKFGARGPVPTEYWGEVWTDGGLATTSSELALIGNALYAGNLLAPASVRAMLPPRPHGWGFGTFDKYAVGARWVGHDGSYGGFQTENWTDRARGVTVDVFANGAGPRTYAARIWRQVATAYGR